jgi:hypothetical protein
MQFYPENVSRQMVTFQYLYTNRYLVSRDSGSGRAPQWRRPLTILYAELCGITDPAGILPYLLWESATFRRLLTEGSSARGKRATGDGGIVHFIFYILHL